MTFIVNSERVRRLSQEGLWVILGQAMAVIGSLVGVRLLTGLLNPAAYGELALGMTIATLVNQSLLGPLSAGVTRFYSLAIEQRDLGGYLSAVRRLMLIATGVIILMILLSSAGLFFTGLTEWAAITITAFVFAILSGYNTILSGIQNAARQRSIVALHQGMEPWLRFFVAVGLMVWLGATSTMAMFGYCVAIALVVCSQYLFFRIAIPGHISATDKEKDWRGLMWNFSWPISVFGIFTWLQLVSDRWALKVFATTQDVGLYAVLFQLGYYPISMATGIMMQFLAPIFYQRAGGVGEYRRRAGVNKLSWRLTGISLGVTFVAFGLAFLFHKEIFRVFAAKEYASLSFFLPWMLLAGGIFSAGETMGLNLMSQMKTHTMAVAKIVTALLGVILNVAGAYWYGTRGVVYAGVVFSVSYFIWLAVLSRHNHAGMEKCA